MPNAECHYAECRGANVMLLCLKQVGIFWKYIFETFRGSFSTNLLGNFRIMKNPRSWSSFHFSHILFHISATLIALWVFPDMMFVVAAKVEIHFPQNLFSWQKSFHAKIDLTWVWFCNINITPTAIDFTWKFIFLLNNCRYQNVLKSE
jgi:hypothetical protein